MKTVRFIHTALLLLASAAVPLCAAAETPAFETVCASLASHANTSGTFTQKKTIAKIQRTLTSSGTFIISRDSGIVWKTVKPFASTAVVMKDRIIQTAADGSTSVLAAQGNETFKSISSTIASVFNGDTAALQSSFTVVFSAEKTADGTYLWKSQLTPKDSSMRSFIAVIILSGTAEENGSGAQITDLQMTETAGGSILYGFTGQKYPEELTADEKAYFAVQ